MVDLKLTADEVRFRRMQTGKISYFKSVNEQERNYRYDPYGSGLSIQCNNLAMELIDASLETHYDHCRIKYDNGFNRDKLFLVFTLPLVEKIGAINSSYVWGCSYLPILGEIHSVWVMEKGKDVIDKNEGLSKDNSVDLSPYIDFEKVVSFEMDERCEPLAGARFTERGIANIAPEVVDIISKVESIIADINYDRANVTIEDLKKIIAERLEPKQGRVRHK